MVRNTDLLWLMVSFSSDFMYVYIYNSNLKCKLYVINFYSNFLLASHTCHNSILIEFWGLFSSNIDKI